MAQARPESLGCRAQLGEQDRRIGRDALGRRRRRRRPQIGDEVGDGDVDLVSDGGDDRDRTRRDRAGHGFLVEGPQVLHGAPSPADDDDIRQPGGGQTLERPCDLDGRPLALDPRTGEDDATPWSTAGENRRDVAERRTGRRGDDADTPRVPGQRALERRAQKALTLQTASQLLERQAPQTLGAVGLQAANDHLVFAPGLIQREVTEHPDFHALVGVRGEVLGLPVEHDGAELCPFVLEREVAVTGPGARPRTDLPADPERLDAALEQPADGAVHLRDGPHLRRPLGNASVTVPDARCLPATGLRRFLLPPFVSEEVQTQIVGQGVRRRPPASRTVRCWPGAW